MASEMVVWTLDDGYGDGKGYTGKGNGLSADEKDNWFDHFIKTGELMIPYYVSAWKNPPKPDLKEGHKVDPFAYITVEYDGKKYLVGQGAIDQDGGGAWVGGENKHKDKNFPVFLATFLGIMGITIDSDTIIVDSLGMGLPVEAHEDEKRHELLRSLVLNKTHKVDITLYDGQSFTKDTFVKDLIVKNQPFGTVCDLFLNKEGEIENKIIPRQFNVVSDIGARTWNLYALNDLDPVDELCDQTYDGMFEAYKIVADSLKDMKGKVPLLKIPSLLMKGEFIDRDGHVVKLDKIKADAYDSHANKITTLMNEKAVNWWPLINRIIWTGGGGDQLKAYLPKYLPENVEQVFKGRFTAAIGMWKYVVRETKRRKQKPTKATAKAEIAASKEIAQA